MALVSSAISRGPPFPPGFSLGRETCPNPFFSVICARSGRKLPFSSARNGCVSLTNARFPHALSICASFSSSVIRASKSATRCSMESFGFLYAGTSCAMVGAQLAAPAKTHANTARIARRTRPPSLTLTTSGTSWPLHSLGRVVLYTAVNVNGKEFCDRAFMLCILTILFFDSCPGDLHERRPVSAETGAQIYVWALDGRQPRPRPLWRFRPSAYLSS